MQVQASEVIDKLSLEIAEMAKRLAIAEASYQEALKRIEELESSGENVGE